MDRISERRNNLVQIRKFHFITDNSAKAESESDLSSSYSQIQFYSRSKARSEFKSFAKLKEQIRKARKFLTESQRQSYESSYSQQNEQYSPKRKGGDLQNVGHNPEKKVKINEEQVDLNKILEQGLSFVQKMKSSLATHKK